MASTVGINLSVNEALEYAKIGSAALQDDVLIYDWLRVQPYDGADDELTTTTTMVMMLLLFVSLPVVR